MSVKLNILRKLVRELIKREIEEATMTGNIDGGAGPPKTPLAFKKKKKGQDESGLQDGHVDPTVATDYEKVKESVNEAGGVVTARIQQKPKGYWAVFNKKGQSQFEGNKKFMINIFKKASTLSPNAIGSILDRARLGDKHLEFKAQFSRYYFNESINEGKLNEFMYAKLGSKVEKFVKQYYGKNKFVSLPAWKVTMTYPDQPGRTHDQWVKAKSAKDAIQISKKMWSNQNIKVGKAIFDDEHWLGVQKAQKTGFTEGEIKIKKESVNEGRYHAWRNDDSLSPKQKIGIAMRETRDSLKELERVVRYNVKLKNELKVDSRDYWKNTHKALNKISERLVKLANKVGQLH